MNTDQAAAVLAKVASLWPANDWTQDTQDLFINQLLDIRIDVPAAIHQVEMIRLGMKWAKIDIGSVVTPLRERANRYAALHQGTQETFEPPKVVKLRKSLNFPDGPVIQLACLWMQRMVIDDFRPVPIHKQQANRIPVTERRQRADAMGVAISLAFGLIEEALGKPDPDTDEQWAIHFERFIDADPVLAATHRDLRHRNANLHLTAEGAAFLKKAQYARENTRSNA